MKTLDQIRISFDNGNLDTDIDFDITIGGKVLNEVCNNKNLLIEDNFDFNQINKMNVDDEINFMTDEGVVYLKRVQTEVVEEWFEILSDKLIDAGINHKVAATGTIYIQFSDHTLRIADHDPNGSEKIDLDADKIEDNFESFLEALESNDIDNINEFIYLNR